MPLADPASLAVQASSSTTVSTPAISIDPYLTTDSGHMATIRGAHTWFWVDASSWVPLSPRVDAGPVWAQATITPVQLVITLNDGSGTVHTCDGPGTPLPEGVPMSEPSPTCSVKFTIATSGVPWPVSVHAVYSVSWSGFDGTSTVGGTLPDLVSAPVAYPMLVLAAKPALIDPNTPTD